ncbi:hypothetical protein GN958_ATG10822 [Phytophthora infestans]|uniref:Uncharacterized protein n=1 Tax=Phytophthora infestans TaxID=4787 RepID=A0A8S9UGS3_PHYIN|nr:hypothetical protein GN958_ATG10822 [Phytophthora infestans]
MNNSILDFYAIFDVELKIDLRERDGKSRMINYFMRRCENILQYGMVWRASSLLLAGMNEKYRIQRKHLEPATLREAVDVHLRIEDANSKLDENTLCILASPGALRNAGKFKSDDDQGSRHDN